MCVGAFIGCSGCVLGHRLRRETVLRGVQRRIVILSNYTFKDRTTARSQPQKHTDELMRNLYTFGGNDLGSTFPAGRVW
eukprot:4273829-Prymnesium_polylepis.1